MKRKYRDQTLQGREYDIIDFIRNHPYCSKDKLFTEGKIPKSRATYDLIEKLISEKKVKILHTKSGRETYTLDYYSDTFKLLRNLMGDIEYDLIDDAKRYSKLAKLSLLCSKFFKLRLKILDYESERVKILNLRPDYTIIGKIIDFRLWPTNPELKKLEKYIESEIRRDEDYWKHERHAGDNRRSLDELMKIKKDGRYKIRLKKRDYEAHSRKVKADSEISKRWLAEMGRTLYNNSDESVKTILRKGIRKRLVTIQKDPSKSINYEKESKQLEFLLHLLKKVPLVKLTDNPRYGRAILKAILGEKYEEKLKDKYFPDELPVLKEVKEFDVNSSLIAFDKFLSSRE